MNDGLYEVIHEKRADPIITPLAILLINIGIPSAIAIAGANIAVAAAISIGISAASSLLQQKKSQQGLDPSASAAPPLNTPEVRYTTRQSAPPKRIIVGTALVGGALAFEDVKPPYLTHLYLLNAGQITGVRDIFIGTNQVAYNKTGTYLPTGILGALGHLDNGVITSTPDYANNLLASIRLGTDSQAIDPLIDGTYPSIGAEFRQRGHATVCLRYVYGANFDQHQALWGNGGQPNALFLVDGVAIPDPRNPAHTIFYDPSDPAEVSAAKATWEWSNNASLVQAFYLTQPWGGNIPPSKIDWDRVAAAASYDDELVGVVGGGFIKRHTIDGMISLNQNPATVMQGMLASNRGFLIDSGQKVWVTSSPPRNPTLSIYDDILIGGLEFRGAKPKRDLVNKVRSRFIASDREYNLVDGPIFEDTAAQVDDGEILESVPLDLPYVLDHRRAQRLMKGYLQTARLGKSLIVHVDILLLTQCSDEIIGAACTVSSSLFPECNGIYIVTQVAFAENFSQLDLSLVEYDKTIETDWDFNVDEKSFTLPPVDVS